MSIRLDRCGAGVRLAAAAVAALCASSALAQSGTVNSAIREQVATESAARATQQRVNQIDDQTRTAVGEYRAALQETDSLRRYNAQLSEQIKSQEDEMVSIAKQIEQIEITAREVVPMMQRMLTTLEQFVALDIPFLPAERRTRVETLKEMMGRADVSIAEKYRRITEAYQVEMEYGRTLEAYQASLIGPGATGDKTVDFLRVGRLALLYQTLDGKQTGYWDAQAKQWVEDDDYDDAVRLGLKIAKKQTAPNLLTVPVLAPKGNN